MVDIVNVAMVATVTRCPYEHTVLNSHGAERQQDEPDNRVRLIRPVRPQPVIPHCDGHTVQYAQDNERNPRDG